VADVTHGARFAWLVQGDSIGDQAGLKFAGTGVELVFHYRLNARFAFHSARRVTDPTCER
jgi:hypothetical protein